MLLKFMSFSITPKAQFIIPLYQRAYAWDVDNCKRLLMILSKFIKTSYQVISLDL
jgi:uncharacterized protein with ParB-like and HNH nuclease domain